MSGDMLSQDEIDALLRGTGGDSEESEEATPENNYDEYLSLMEKDALGEIGNISFGSSATALSTLLNQKVDITTPTVTVVPNERIKDEFPHPYVGIQVSYTEGFSGSNLLVIKQSDAAIIVDLMLGGDGTTPSEMLDEIRLSAVQEAMNQMMGSAATSMSTIFSKKVDISPPTINILDVANGEGTDQFPQDDLLVKVSFRIKVGNLIDSTIMQLLPLEFSKELVNELINPGPTLPASSSTGQSQSGNQNNYNNVEVVENNLNAPVNSSFQQGSTAGNMSPQQKVEYHSTPQHFGNTYQGATEANIQPAVFSSFEQQPAYAGEPKNLNMLLDIPLQVTVELGKTKRTVKDILELTSGSIIELDKLAGEPVDILVNNRLVAKGEVVVIDENFGVRVTDIISQSDRIKNLR